VQALLGVRPPAIISLGATDCRFWRAAGTPAYVYGCSPAGMGAPNESVSIDEFLHVVRTHTLSAYDYLSEPCPRARRGRSNHPRWDDGRSRPMNPLPEDL